MTRPGWTRRGVGAAGLGLAAAPSLGAAATADPLSGAALYSDVKAYAALGHHRTGGPGDAACSAWLARGLKAAGYAVERQDFELNVFDLERAEVRAGARSFEAFPLWTPRAGRARGLLSRTAAPGAVALLSLPYGTGAALETSQAWRKPVQAAIDAGAAAVVVITEHPLGELAAYNCAPGMAPWRVPVVGVAGRDGSALQTLPDQGVEVAITGATRAGRGDNLIATRKGAGKPLVISTPKSGWFTCAGERGSGLAIWLGLARRFAKSDRALIFAANSGHEFDGHGGRLFAEHLAPTPGQARGWVHIGANVAAYDFAMADGEIARLARPQPARRLAVSEALLPAAKAASGGQPSYERPIDIDVEQAPGEIAEYQRRGYRPLATLVGTHPLHHTRRDLPDATGPELLEPVARGLAALIERF